MARLAALLRSVWRNLVGRDRVERRLDEELRAYVELLTEENLRAGMSPEEARRRAMKECGVEQVKEEVRDVWVGDRLVNGVSEVRYAVRSLLRSPAYLLVSVATLAIGLGGAVAVFTVVKGSLLRPLPGTAEPDRLVSVERVQRGTDDPDWSYPDYRDLRDRSTTLEGLAAYNGTPMTVDDASGSTRAMVSYVSGDFFAVLGAQAALGRLFGGSGEQTAATDDGRVVVLSYDLWQSRYAGSRDVIGSQVDLNGHDFTIVGVATRGFVGAMARYPMEMWIPLASEGRLSPPLAAYGSADIYLTSRRPAWLRLVGRLAPGWAVQDAQAELVTVADWMASAHATNRERSVHVFPGAGMTADERVELSRTPRLLALAVGLLLLIACGNVAALALVRSAARRRELAARLALGASRGRLIRQVAIEGAVLAVLAGSVGVLLARALVHSTTLVGTVVDIPDPDLTLDGRVLAVALAASGVTALWVSLIPALQILRVPAGAVLREGGGAVGRTSGGARGQRAVVAVQVAASLVLLAAAAMIFNAFQRVLSDHNDVDPRGLAYADFDATASIPEPTERIVFYRGLLSAAAAEPGFEGAALTSTIPPFDWTDHVRVFRRGEEPAPSELAGSEVELGTRVSALTVSEGFFDVLRIPVERGRPFAASDDADAEPVVILGRRLADALWPGETALGRYIAWPAVEGPARPPLRIVGVVGDTRPVVPGGEAPLSMYLPFAQRAQFLGLALVVRTRGNAPVDEATWRGIAAFARPGVTVSGTGTLLERLSAELRPERTASAWVGVFGLIALLLAALGAYGVLAQSVLQRSRELAVRSVLGATPNDLLAAVTAEGVRLAVVGGALGAVGALVAFRVVQGMFAAVSLTDIRAAAVALAFLAGAMLVATWIPARRAMRLDPAALLRSD